MLQSSAPGGAVEQRDLAAQRHADDPRPAQGGRGERRSHVAGEAGAEPVGDPRSRRSARDHDGDPPSARSEVGRCGDAAEPDDDLRPGLVDGAAGGGDGRSQVAGQPREVSGGAPGSGTFGMVRSS